MVYTTPGTRVNRYISRLLEARQTELEMADLNFFTLKYKHVEREQKVRDVGILSLSLRLWRSSDGLIILSLSLSLSLSLPPSPLFPHHALFLSPLLLFLPSQYHQLQDEYFTSAVVLALILAALFGLIYLLVIPQ